MSLPDDISPRVRRLVEGLNAAGWPTCDSGDGSNAAAGMEGARDYPHVVIRLPWHRVSHLIDEADAVRVWLSEHGVWVRRQGEETANGPCACVQATFDPAHPGVALIDVMHVTDDMLDDSGDPQW